MRKEGGRKIEQERKEKERKLKERMRNKQTNKEWKVNKLMFHEWMSFDHILYTTKNEAKTKWIQETLFCSTFILINYSKFTIGLFVCPQIRLHTFSTIIKLHERTVNCLKN